MGCEADESRARPCTTRRRGAERRGEAQPWLRCDNASPRSVRCDGCYSCGHADAEGAGQGQHWDVECFGKWRAPGRENPTGEASRGTRLHRTVVALPAMILFPRCERSYCCGACMRLAVAPMLTTRSGVFYEYTHTRSALS